MPSIVARAGRASLTEVARDGIDRAARRVAAAHALVVAHGLASLEPVELPPVAGGADAARALAELAPLYLLSELDEAGLFDAGDRLAGQYTDGSLGHVGSAEVALAELWRSRHRRFDAAERAALFGRLFGGEDRPSLAGGGQNHAFEVLLAQFADAVIGEGPGSPVHDVDLARVSIAAERLLATALGYGMVVPRLASQELLDQARLVLSIIQEPAIQAALGRSTPWGVVAALRNPTGPGLRGADDAVVATHVARARAGVILLGWLADQPVAGRGRRRLPAPPSEVVAAAFEWLEATVGAPS